jgi:hypothetical protein
VNSIVVAWILRLVRAKRDADRVAVGHHRGGRVLHRSRRDSSTVVNARREARGAATARRWSADGGISPLVAKPDGPSADVYAVTR